MDKRIFDMLEQYKQMNRSENLVNFKEVPMHEFCLETDYSAVDPRVLAMAFINMQPLDDVYETEDGFSRGSIFPNIDKPYLGCDKI